MQRNRPLASQPWSEYLMSKKNIRKQVLFLVLIVLHVGTSVFLDYSDRHIFSGSLAGERSFRTHDCGARELHPDLDAEGTCLICLQIGQFAASIPAAGLIVEDLVAQVHFLDFLSLLQSPTAFSLRQRGPPAFLA
jgi:hypothetical protein